MHRFVFFVSVLAVSATMPIDDPIENTNEPRANAYGQPVLIQNGLSDRVQCVTTTVDSVVSIYKRQSIWNDFQGKLQENMSNMILCLRYTGFSAQG